MANGHGKAARTRLVVGTRRIGGGPVIGARRDGHDWREQPILTLPILTMTATGERQGQEGGAAGTFHGREGKRAAGAMLGDGDSRW